MQVRARVERSRWRPRSTSANRPASRRRFSKTTTMQAIRHNVQSHQRCQQRDTHCDSIHLDGEVCRGTSLRTSTCGVGWLHDFFWLVHRKNARLSQIRRWVQVAPSNLFAGATRCCRLPARQQGREMPQRQQRQTRCGDTSSAAWTLGCEAS